MTKITEDNILAAMNIFQTLDYGKGKVTAGNTLRAAINNFIEVELQRVRPAVLFTKKEISEMKQGNKLEAVKLIKDRLAMGLMDSKLYVENNGGDYLAESGKYNKLGQYINY